MNPTENISGKYKRLIADRRFVRALLGGVALLIIALFINYYAAVYAFDRVSNSVTDIILSNVPVIDVDNIFIFGPIIFWAVIAAFCLYEPRRLPFTLKSIALFVIVRSIFITLTHLGPYPDHISLDINTMLMSRWNLGNLLTFGSGGDLFFSGHTGLPFLFALIFWKNYRMRIFCIIGAIFFGIVVLLGHLHYSIDVMAAFFITYSIYHIAEWLFKEDLGTFHKLHDPATNGKK